MFEFLRGRLPSAVWLLSMAVFALGGLGSCTWKSNVQPSVLVILVENLGFNAVSCGESADFEPGSGFQVFCEESVRFTHAYTPSLMSQATIASIMTARSPHEHGVRHNGAQALAARELTLAEAALLNGFRTSFYSGGPPVFRRSGINQGFEVFDDSISVNYKRLYRPADEIVSLFLNWQENEASKRRFLSFLYLPDAQLIDVPTTNQLGELRPSSYESQIDVIDEALGDLAKELKRRKVWENTDIFLVGLNGNPEDSRPSEMPAMDLFSDRTRTTLMVKPARKKRETPFNWKIDANVSLVDIGVTLYELVGAKLPMGRSQRAVAPVSLRSVMTGPQPDWPEDREILSESAWSSWRGLGGVRAALRKGPFLYFFDEHDRLFNTLTDNFEVMPLPRKEDLPASTRAAMARFLEEIGFSAWQPVSRLEVEKAALGRELWRSRNPDAETLAAFRQLQKRNPEDLELRGWRALIALRQGDWKDLKAAAGQPITQPLWAFVAAKNLGEKIAPPNDPCLAFLKPDGDRRVSKECAHGGIRDLADWANESLPEDERNRAMESFMRFYLVQALETRVAEYNQVAGRIWDTPLKVENPEEDELILALPEMKKVRAIVRARLTADRSR